MRLMASVWSVDERVYKCKKFVLRVSRTYGKPIKVIARVGRVVE